MVTEKTNVVVKGLISEIDENGVITVIDKDETDTVNIISLIEPFVGSDFALSITKSEKKI